MPDYTDNYGLAKPYEHENYDINVQNDNMDIVDAAIKTVDDGLTDIGNELEAHKDNYTQQRQQDQLKVANVERELNDYKSTMQQVNVNQEAKQQATGYGVVDLPPNAANGQVSDVLIKGNTIYNILDNGVDYSNWTVSGTSSTVGTSGIHLVQDGVLESARITCEDLKPSTQYTLVYNIKNISPNMSWVLQGGVPSSYPIVDQKKLSNSIGVNKVLITTLDTMPNKNLRFAIGSSVPDGDYVDFELYAILEGDYTADDSVNKPFKFGVNSTISASRLKSVGKNLFDKNKALSRPRGYIAADASINFSALTYYNIFIKIKPNTNYKMVNHLSSNTFWFNSIPSTMLGTFDSTGGISPSNANYLGITLIVENIDIVQIEKGTVATPYEPYTESNAYFICKDPETSEILEARSVPSANDEVRDIIRITNGKAELIRKVGNKKDVPNGTVINYADMADDGVFEAWGANGEHIVGVKGDTLDFGAVELNYQMAEPVEIPIEVSGNIVSHPSGTVYIDHATFSMGVYQDGIEVLHGDLPIKEVNKILKIDYLTGVEHEIDTDGVTIVEGGLSFTHTGLTDGDIVWFDYDYDVESTEGEAAIEYYDSRYTIKDDVTDKFYKWNITVSNGQPSIQLQEV